MTNVNNCYFITFAFNFHTRNVPSRGREARVIPMDSKQFSNNIQTVAAPQFNNYHQQQPQQQVQYQKYIPIQTSGGMNMYLSKRMSNDDSELDPNKRLPPDEKIISRIQQQVPTPPQRQSYNSPREVSETDLYLLGAIEKLAYRVDYLEKRLKRTEQIVYYLMSGNNQQNNEKPEKPTSALPTPAPVVEKDPCPKNFRQIGEVCYHLSNSERVDWKTAATKCKSLGAILAEFDKVDKFRDVIGNILNHKTHRGHDFWIGGLNPGLLWIWSTSARPVNPNTNLTTFNNKSETVNKIPVKVLNQANQNKTSVDTSTVTANFPDIVGDGRCLRLSYNPSTFGYGYTGHDCSAKQVS